MCISAFFTLAEQYDFTIARCDACVMKFEKMSVGLYQIQSGVV